MIIMKTQTCMYAFIHEADSLIYIRLLWQCCSVCLCRHWCTFTPLTLLCWSAADRTTWTPPPCPFLSYASVFFLISPCPPALSSDWLRHFTQTVGHSTRAKGKCGWKGGGQASCTVPHQARWGECRPFTRGLSCLSTICSLPLKKWSLSTKWDISLTTPCWPWLFGHLKYNSWIIFSKLGLVFILWRVTHLPLKDKLTQKFCVFLHTLMESQAKLYSPHFWSFTAEQHCNFIVYGEKKHTKQTKLLPKWFEKTLFTPCFRAQVLTSDFMCTNVFFKKKSQLGILGPAETWITLDKLYRAIF